MKAAKVSISRRVWRKVYWAWRNWRDDPRTTAWRTLDRPGGRWLLSASTTRWTQSITQDDLISVFYDEMWIDRVDDTSVPRSRRFNYPDWHLQHLRKHLRRRLDGSVDFWTFLYKPKTGDIVFDIGAGVGVDAIVFSQLVGDTGRVYAFEAHPWTFRALEKCCALNRLSVEPVQMAVADAKGTLWISDLTNDELNSISKKSGDGFVTAVQRLTSIVSFQPRGLHASRF